MQSPKARILYTEDNSDSRAVVAFILNRNDYEVVCVETAEEALVLAKNLAFDLFLVDNWLPGLSGPELTRHIREFDRTTPILFYSAAAYDWDKQAALDAGAQGYLIKPLDLEVLLAEVERLINESVSVYS